MVFILIIITCLFFLIKNVVKNSQIINNNWSFHIDSVQTESCIKLIDINEDGLDDFIFGVLLLTNETQSNNTGLVIGVRGYDGKILYKFSTKSEILFLIE